MRQVVRIEHQHGYPSRFNMEWWGSAPGNTLREVCENVIASEPNKLHWFKAVDEWHCTDFGFPLRLLEEEHD